MDMIEEHGIAEFDALRQAHDVYRTGTAQDPPLPAERSGPPERVERALKGLRAGAVVDDMRTFTARQANRCFCELAFGIHDHMIGARGFGNRHLASRGNTADDMAAPQLDDLGEKQTETAGRRVNQRDIP